MCYQDVVAEYYNHEDIVIVYHRVDLDGRCSAALACLWVDLFFGLSPEHTHLVGANYGDRIYNEDWPELPKRALVFVLDFSYPVKDMKKLCEDHTVVWVDHHKTAIEDIRNAKCVKYDFSSVVDVDGNKISAAGLFCNEFFSAPRWDPKEHISDGSDVDLFAVRRVARLVSDWDVWNTDLFWDPTSEIYQFQMGMRKLNTSMKSVEHFLRGDWLSHWMDPARIYQTMDEGKKEIQRKEREYERRMKDSFDAKFSGGTWRCVNASGLGSQAFRSVYNPDIHVGFISFAFSGDTNKWEVELRGARSAIDVSEVALFFGGSGHFGAAGFSTNILPFNLPVPALAAAYGKQGASDNLKCPNCGGVLDETMREDNLWQCYKCEALLSLYVKEVPDGEC